MRTFIRVVIVLALLVPMVSIVNAQDRQEVRFLIQELDPPSLEAYTSMEAEFEAEFPQYDVVIEFTNADSVMQKVTTVIASGGTLDVFQPDPGTAARLAQEGQLLAIDGVVDSLGGAEEFLPNTLLEVDGTPYCMPYASGSPVLWYRTDLFEEAGIEPPTTWDEWLAAAEALTTDDHYGIAIAGGENTFTTITAQMLLWSAGTELINDDFSVKAAGNERAAETLQFYADLLQYAPPGAASYSFFEVIDAFTSGQVAMGVYWGRMLGRVYSDGPDLIGKIGAVPLPMNRMPATFADISYNCIYGDTASPEGALAWVEFMSRPEQAVKFQLTVPGHLAPVTNAQVAALAESGDEILGANPDIADVLFGVNDYAYNVNLNAGSINEEDLTIEPTGIVNTANTTLWGSNLLAAAVQQVAFEGTDPMDALDELQTDLEAALEEAG